MSCAQLAGFRPGTFGTIVAVAFQGNWGQQSMTVRIEARSKSFSALYMHICTVVELSEPDEENVNQSDQNAPEDASVI